MRQNNQVQNGFFLEQSQKNTNVTNRLQKQKKTAKSIHLLTKKTLTLGKRYFPAA